MIEAAGGDLGGREHYPPRMKRTLSLKRETLTLLSNNDLAAVDGASLPTPATAVASLDPLTTCVAIRESVLQCTGPGCDTWNSDCSCFV